MTTIKLNNAARSAIKTALRGKVAGLDTMTKDMLIAAAEQAGIDVQAVCYAAITGGPPIDPSMNEQTFDAASLTRDAVREDISSALTEATDDAPAIAPEIAAELSEIDAAWKGMDATRYHALLSDLATRAHKPAEVREVIKQVTVYRDGPAPITPEHISQRVGQTTSKALFGAKGELSKVAMAIWDCPHAPAIDPLYVWPEAAPAIVSQLFKRHNPAFIWGPAGTGKTSFVEQLAAHLKRPYTRISCHAQTDAATLIGMTAPKAGGGTEWKDGQLTAAGRIPGNMILIDEPTVARPGTLYVLQAILDTRTIHIDETGEVVPLADGVLIVFADNTNGSGDTTGQYGASNEMTEAQRNRFGITTRIDYLAPEVEATVLAGKSGCTPQLASLLVSYANVTRKKAQSGDLPAGISLRNLLFWAQQLTDGVNHTAAADGAFLDRMSPERAEVMRQLLTTHCSAGQVRDALAGRDTVSASDAPVMQPDGSFPPITE